jgi:hypothetical protein
MIHCTWDGCTRVFRNSTNDKLKHHLCTHTQTYPFNCVKCNRGWPVRQGLDNHTCMSARDKSVFNICELKIKEQIERKDKATRQWWLHTCVACKVRPATHSTTGDKYGLTTHCRKCMARAGGGRWMHRPYCECGQIANYGQPASYPRTCIKHQRSKETIHPERRCIHCGQVATFGPTITNNQRCKQHAASTDVCTIKI